jgi:hypothetical protein
MACLSTLYINLEGEKNAKNENKEQRQKAL